MNVLFVSQYFAPEPFSNTRVVQNLVEYGAHTEVLCAVPNYPQGEFYSGYKGGRPVTETIGGVKVHRARTVARGTRKSRLVLNYLSFAFFGSLRAMFDRFEKPDVILLSQLSPILMAFPAVLLGWRYRVPVVYWVQDIWPESATYTLGIRHPVIVKPLSALCGWLYRRAEYVMVQSDALPPMIERFGVDKSRISVLPNTASDIFRPVPPSQAPAEAEMVPEHGFRICFAGNIGEAQDFDTIIEAATLLPDALDIQWIIIGSGRDLDRTIKRVKQSGIANRFHFLGRHPEERMPFFFAHADAMLVSLKKNDIFAMTVPYKMQCYMACGKPIIASLDGEGARIVQEAGAGVTAPSQSPQELARAIAGLVATFTEKRSEFEANSLAYFQQHYSKAEIFKALTATLELACQRPRQNSSSDESDPRT